MPVGGVVVVGGTTGAVDAVNRGPSRKRSCEELPPVGGHWARRSAACSAERTTFGDIAHFCSVYDIEVPASRSRASAISRVFSTIAAMSAEDIQILVDYGAFSGPARLGPISDAIARRSRAQA